MRRTAFDANVNYTVMGQNLAAFPGSLSPETVRDGETKLPALHSSTETLPRPYSPGFNQGTAGPGSVLDPNYPPNVIDSFDFTIRRQLSRRSAWNLATLVAESLTSISLSTLTQCPT